MKFTGIVASLAVASSASALAIPQTPVQATLMRLNNALNNVEGLVGGLLSGVCQQVDLTQVQTQLVDIKGQLTQLVPVSVPTKRDIMGTANDVATPATTVAGSEVNTVQGVAQPVTDVAGGAVGTVQGVAGAPVSAALGVAGGAVGTVENTAGGLVGNVQNMASGPVSTVTGTAGVNTLAQDLVSKVQSGALTAAGLASILNQAGLASSPITSVLAGLLNRLASSALQALEVDAELSPFVRRSFALKSPTQSSTTDEDEAAKTVLETTYRATTNRMLRVAVNGFMESLGVVLGVMEELDVDVLSEEIQEEK
ncbi:hypothetical protein CNMCM5793_008585 [Aspergillus hiratsukae]|uniref:Uncharacterized protein n=1 Tax=Aspergillus hiratsukae TaxID=1194566 RepID=A0A8H6P7C6_9EURO|nr:hypothetical protein CNMCM5793_008585 [Aspergillus hiratsukae]KAF7160436.1 hypothetical protein CNMCM6106_007916 [Aspergillus hiratsukae]